MPPQVIALRKSTRSLFMTVAAVLLVAANLLSAQAASLSDASLSLSDPRPDETNVTYTFTADGFSGIAECITLQLAVNADGTGGVPAGLDSTGSALSGSSDMITPGSWSLDDNTNGTLKLTNSGGELPAQGELIFTGVTNSNADGTNYAILTTFSDDVCSAALDSVTVAYSYTDGALVTLTINPSLTFSVAGIGQGTSVNGSPNTSIASTGTAIDFGDAVTSSTNGVSAHDLDVTTNASGGYTVYIRHSGDLENGNGDTISAHTGTNAAPTAFPVAGNEAWGYTTDDTDLAQFGSNEWAGFTTTNQPVMINSVATAGTDSNNVAHQVGVAPSTEAGDYQTTIIYTIVATY